MESFRVVLAESNGATLQHLEHLLSSVSSLSVVRTAVSEVTLYEAVATSAPDCVLLGQFSVASVRSCKQTIDLYGDVALLRIIPAHQPVAIAEDLLAGAIGYIAATAAAASFEECIVRSCTRHVHLDADVAAALWKIVGDRHLPLPHYGRLVLAGMVQGLSEQEIAVSLQQQGAPAQIDAHSIRNQLYNLIRTLHRTEGGTHS